MVIDWTGFEKRLLDCVGVPYEYGAEANLKSDATPKKLDCSELVEWAYARSGVRVPDGSENQFKASVKVACPRLGDLGFNRPAGRPAHHVVIHLGKDTCIEARGAPKNAVVITAVKKWESWKDFTGWYRPKAVIEMEKLQ